MRFSWFRSSIAELAGGLAWYVRLHTIFGAARGILSNSNLQSQKMMIAFTDARSSENPSIIVIGLIWGIAYGSIARAWTVIWWQRGLQFAPHFLGLDGSLVRVLPTVRGVQGLSNELAVHHF